MSHSRGSSIKSVKSILSALSITSDDYNETYEDDTLLTDNLVAEAKLKAINPNIECLRAAHKKCHLDKRLLVLHIAIRKGPDAVVAVAKGWLDHLFFPIQAIAIKGKAKPSGSQTPTLEETAVNIESANQLNQPNLRKKVAQHEGYRCAISKFFDIARIAVLLQSGERSAIPERTAQAQMDAAHIIPFSLNGFLEGTHATARLMDAARTWDMLQAWTGIKLGMLVGENINEPKNAIYMTRDNHDSFRQFRFYLDKEVYPEAPNKYKARMLETVYSFNNGGQSAVVEFATSEASGYDPPSSELIRIHAAFAKVLHLSGAAEYVESLQRDSKQIDTLFLCKEVDFSASLMSRLDIIAY